MSIFNPCEKCVTDRSLCDGCRNSPKYADYPNKSLFRAFNPTCPLGYDDCIHDPAYIKHHYPKWYQELYGDLTPEEAAKTKEGCNPDLEDEWCSDYDDEDK